MLAKLETPAGKAFGLENWEAVRDDVPEPLGEEATETFLEVVAPACTTGDCFAEAPEDWTDFPEDTTLEPLAFTPPDALELPTTFTVADWLGGAAGA